MPDPGEGGPREHHHGLAGERRDRDLPTGRRAGAPAGRTTPKSTEPRTTPSRSRCSCGRLQTTAASARPCRTASTASSPGLELTDDLDARDAQRRRAAAGRRGPGRPWCRPGGSAAPGAPAPRTRTSSRARSTSARITRARSTRTARQRVSSAPLRSAVEERDAQVPLQRTDLLGERRSGDVQPARGAEKRRSSATARKYLSWRSSTSARYRRTGDRRGRRVRQDSGRVVFGHGDTGCDRHGRAVLYCESRGPPRPVEQPVRRGRACARGSWGDMSSKRRRTAAGRDRRLGRHARPNARRAMLEVLRRVVPFDGALLALRRPAGPRLPLPGERRPGRPDRGVPLRPAVNARDIEVTGTDRARPPLGPSDLPYPAEELPTWAECLIPAGIHEALGLALFAPGRRHVGYLAVLSGEPAATVPGQPPPTRAARAGARARHRPDAVAAHRRPPGPGRHGRRGALRGRRLPGAAGPAGGRAAGPPAPPSWPPHAGGSATGRCTRLSSGRWGAGTRPDGHVRVTVLAAPEDVAARADRPWLCCRRRPTCAG